MEVDGFDGGYKTIGSKRLKSYEVDYDSLSQEQIEKFAKEDPKVKQHLEVIRRKELLELVLEKMESLRQLEGRERDQPMGGRKEEKERGRWGLF